MEFAYTYLAIKINSVISALKSCLDRIMDNVVLHIEDHWGAKVDSGANEIAFSQRRRERTHG